MEECIYSRSYKHNYCAGLSVVQGSTVVMLMTVIFAQASDYGLGDSIMHPIGSIREKKC